MDLVIALPFQLFVLSLLLVSFYWLYGMFWDFHLHAATEVWFPPMELEGWGAERFLKQEFYLGEQSQTHVCECPSALHNCAVLLQNNKLPNASAVISLMSLSSWKIHSWTENLLVCELKRVKYDLQMDEGQPRSFVTETCFFSICHLKECPSFFFSLFFAFWLDCLPPYSVYSCCYTLSLNFLYALITVFYTQQLSAKGLR